MKLSHLTRFSLRFLLVAITALCIVLGYVVNWVHLRHRHIENLTAIDPYLYGLGSYHNYSNASPTIQPKAFPLILRLLREQPFAYVGVRIPERDTSIKQSTPQKGLTYHSVPTQPDYLRAQALFPESRIIPYVVIGTGDETYHVGVSIDE